MATISEASKHLESMSQPRNLDQARAYEMLTRFYESRFGLIFGDHKRAAICHQLDFVKASIAEALKRMAEEAAFEKKHHAKVAKLKARGEIDKARILKHTFKAYQNGKTSGL